MNSDYVFHSRWHVPLGRDALWEEVKQLLATEDPMAWWQSVVVTHYDGQNLAVRAASRFGYRLSFQLEGLALRPPTGLTFTPTVICGGAAPWVLSTWELIARQWTSTGVWRPIVGGCDGLAGCCGRSSLPGITRSCVRARRT